jgi:hypothetical protein
MMHLLYHSCCSFSLSFSRIVPLWYHATLCTIFHPSTRFYFGYNRRTLFSCSNLLWWLQNVYITHRFSSIYRGFSLNLPTFRRFILSWQQYCHSMVLVIKHLLYCSCRTYPSLYPIFGTHIVSSCICGIMAAILSFYWTFIVSLPESMFIIVSCIYCIIPLQFLSIILS